MPETLREIGLNLRPALALLCLSVHALPGSDWAPIPPEIWAIREGPKGAVIIEDRLRFQPREMESVYRVRIFSEEGRGAAALPDLPKTAHGIKGRTVYPDGQEITFDSQKDFAERKIETGGREYSQVHLVPPGVTSDCVVEVRWSERADGFVGGLPSRMANGFYGSWRLGRPYPTAVSTIEIARNFPLAFFLSGGTYTRGEDAEKDGFRVITHRNLPARESIPYSTPPLSGFPLLEMFWQSPDLIRAAQRGRESFWMEAFDRVYRGSLEESVNTGGAFKRLSVDLLQGLPETPHARASELLTRLERKIKNASMATAEEKAALPKKFWDGYERKRLDKAAESGMASADGMRVMYYHLLKAAGLRPRIGKVVDREQNLFNFGRLNAWQFHHEILGIEEAGKGVLWLDAGNRYATPGVIHPDYQAVWMLVYTPVDARTWKVSSELLPAAPSAFNTRTFHYGLELGEDSDQFEIKAEFGGYPEFAERYRFLRLDIKEQGRSLKEQFERQAKNLIIAQTKVSDALDPATRLSWDVSGSLERESGRRREVEPFPGMPWPLWVPDKLDGPRSVPIVVPYLSTQVAVSTFKVPSGYRFEPHGELENRNEFGAVAWTASYDPATRQVTVRFSTRVINIKQDLDHWKAFKEFLGWIQEACRRTVILNREG